MSATPPIIGITCDIADDRYAVHIAYARVVDECGGTPLVLPCLTQRIEEYMAICRGFLLTGGDDPAMEQWGIATHPKAKKIDAQRQKFELDLLDALAGRPHVPVLGVCLGMQLMGLHAGGSLDQHLPETLPTASQHWGRVLHPIAGELGHGEVLSHHRQAIADPGTLRAVACAPDGVIEAIAAAHGERRFYLGVQWHPERTDDAVFGRGMIEQLINAAR